MFGPESGGDGWGGFPLVYDRVRTADHARTADYLSIWEGERCKMVEMSCELHDKYAANTQFITHLMGRILGKQVGYVVEGYIFFLRHTHTAVVSFDIKEFVETKSLQTANA